MDFDYFYGRETEQFAFYQIPKTLMFKNHPFKVLDDEELAKQTGESARTVQRFVRLNSLIPELLEQWSKKA